MFQKFYMHMVDLWIFISSFWLFLKYKVNACRFISALLLPFFASNKIYRLQISSPKDSLFALVQW